MWGFSEIDVSKLFQFDTQTPKVLICASHVSPLTLLFSRMIFCLYNVVMIPIVAVLECVTCRAEGDPRIWALLGFHMSLLVTIYFVLILIHTYRNRVIFNTCMAFEYTTVPEKFASFFTNFMWVMFEVVVTLSCLATVVHWTVVYSQSDARLNLASVHIHGAATLTIVAELLLNRMLFVSVHFTFVAIVGGIYAVFAYVVFKEKDILVYFFLNDTELIPGWVSVLLLVVGAVVSFLVCSFIARLTRASVVRLSRLYSDHSTITDITTIRAGQSINKILEY